jgi:hypothetical protein
MAEISRNSPAPACADTLVQIVIWTALYSFPLLLAVNPHLDEDLGFHLRTGQWIVHQGRVPQTDPFSQHGQETGQPWIAYSWLFDVAVHGFHRMLGYPGIVLFRVFLLFAVLAAFHRLIGKREERFLVAAALTGVAFFSLRPLASERPWLLSILFSTLTLDALLDLAQGKRSRAVWLLPVGFALWANVHIQFVVGLLLLGLACVGPIGDWLLGRTGPVLPAGSRGWWRLVGLTLCCLGATLVNPYGVGIYRVVADYATHQAPLRHVAELKALEFRDPWDWCAPLLGGLAAFSLGKRRWSCFEVLLLAAAGWFSFRMRRDLWILVSASLGLLVTAPKSSAGALTFLPSRRQGLLVAAALCVIVGLFWKVRLPSASVRAQLEKEYPVRAVAHVRALLQERGQPVRLYNHFDWGGYLMWELPELPVALDGRTNVHGDARITRMVVTWQGLAGWDRDPELTGADVVIGQAWAPLVSLLRLDERFQLAYEDETAVVFYRMTPF